MINATLCRYVIERQFRAKRSKKIEKIRTQLKSLAAHALAALRILKRR